MGKKLSFLLDESKLSGWAYLYCRDTENNPNIKNLITRPYHAYMFCKYVEDDYDVRQYILKSSSWKNIYFDTIKK